MELKEWKKLAEQQIWRKSQNQYAFLCLDPIQDHVARFYLFICFCFYIPPKKNLTCKRIKYNFDKIYTQILKYYYFRIINQKQIFTLIIHIINKTFIK